MRPSSVPLVILASLVSLSSSVLAACGGGTPPPKDENDVVEHGSAKSDTDTKPASDSPQSSSAAASDPASPPASKKSSVDLVAPTADDPWMAPHQMPASDVRKTMGAAKGKINACWKAARKRDPAVSGEVKIKFVISHVGSVIVWRNEESTASDGDAINCVGEVIRSLKFPTQQAPGSAWGIYMINFGD